MIGTGIGIVGNYWLGHCCLDSQGDRLIPLAADCMGHCSVED